MKIRNILAIPLVYNLFRTFIGSDTVRHWHVSNSIRPRAGDRVLDIGCGTGEMFRFLPDGVSYVGFDLSPEYIETARKRFGERAQFFCASVDGEMQIPEGAFDIALAHGVLHHLTDAQALDLLRLAHRSLKPGGRLVTYDGCYVKGQSPIARYILSRDRGQFVRDQASYEALARQVFGEIKSTVRHDLLRIPYSNLIMECTR